MPLIRTLHRWRVTSPADRLLFLRASVQLLWIRLVLLRRFRQPAVLGVCEPAATSSPVTPEDLARARCYARWLDVAAHRQLTRASCLARSLALHQWLRQEGLPSCLRIGVLKDGDTLRAHAWVELGGLIVNDRQSVAERFRLLSSDGGAADPSPTLADGLAALTRTSPGRG